MFTVTELELDAVASLSASIHLTFFGISFGALVAFAIVLATVSPNDPVIHAMFVALLWVSALMTLYFGIRGINDYITARRKLNEIKSEPSVN